MYDASNKKDIRRAEKAARQAEVARIEYLRAAMSTWQGRAWFYNLLESCHLFADPFTGNPYQEAYLKGERNVGLRLFADISAHCPDEYILMIKEENGRRTERAVRDDIAAGTADGERRERTDSGWDLEGREGREPVSDFDPYADAELN